MKSGPYLTLYTEINSKRIKDLNVKAETTQLLVEENIGVNRHDLRRGNGLLAGHPKAQDTGKERNKTPQLKSVHQRRYPESEDKNHRIGGNICKSHV